ncbi:MULTISPECIES: Cof-type HAD-IIB family hydrolase [Bacillus]|uniref:Cof-type HAD-IIB family hydrolase n=1 Tax=Bacillus TaxID=1386 RepID=UPI0003054952|nr:MULTISPECIES: Cof-type HAD-IIB family hydrolase [Bacillus]
MIKCIAIDMDGTLLNKNEKVSQANEQAFKRAQEQGVEVVVATGRPYIEARHALDEANITCSLISINGAVIWNEKGEKIASNPMLKSDVSKAQKILEDASIYFELFTSKGRFTKKRSVSIAIIMDILKSAFPNEDPANLEKQVNEHFEMGHIHEIDNYEELINDDEVELYKMLAFSHELNQLGKSGEEIKSTTTLVVSSSGVGNLEITSFDAQKGEALEKFVAEKNISLSETMAIGDSYNDWSMFEKAGKAVAMGNAPLDIQEFCDEVTLTNAEDGVAHAILKAISNK